MGDKTEELAGKKVISAQDVSDRLRISLSTVHHLTRTGQIRAVKIGKQWRYSNEEIDRYLMSGFDFRKGTEERRSADRRTRPRINCFIQGRATVSILPLKHLEADGAALNLSESGLCFEITDAEEVSSGNISMDDPVKIVLYFPSALRPEIEIDGRVFHLEEYGKARFGIKFRNLSPEAESLIREYIG